MAHPLRLPRAERQRLAVAVAAPFDGIANRRDLRAAGVSYADIRGEVDAGRWTRLGRHTIGISAHEAVLTERGRWWRAVWESGAGAALDGVAALRAAGLQGFTYDVIDVALPKNSRRHAVAGVRRRHYRLMPPVVGAGLPRVTSEVALLHAMQWASTDRVAALLLCLAVQQRLVSGTRLTGAFAALSRCRRRAFMRTVIRDVCDGAHSLGGLDFAALCRRYGLPPPSRQVVRRGPGGRIYLDVAWDDVGLVVEIDRAITRPRSARCWTRCVRTTLSSVTRPCCVCPCWDCGCSRPTSCGRSCAATFLPADSSVGWCDVADRARPGGEECVAVCQIGGMSLLRHTADRTSLDTRPRAPGCVAHTIVCMPFHLDTDMPRELAPLAWMIGRWRGVGVVGYPTIESANFGQELQVTHDGRPFLHWHSRTWLLDEEGNQVRPLAAEVGFWRPLPDDEVELLLAHPTGIIEMYYGTTSPAKVEVKTDSVVRSPHAKEYNAGHRLYGYVEGKLMYAMDMAAVGQPLQSHLSAELKRVE